MKKTIKKQSSYRDEILRYAMDKYGTRPEYLWARCPNYAILRRADNKKWYGAILDVPRERLGLAGTDVVDVLNVKCDAGLYAFINGESGILRGYHMGGTWVSVLLDGTVAREQIFALLDASYKLVGPRKKVQ